MHNTCINSLISPGLYRPSLSLSFNDYTCFLDNRFDNRTQFSLSPPSCCCCCSNSYSIYRLPINPSLLYGLRQSTLIQCKRLILNGETQCFSRLSSSSVGNFDRNCYYEKKIGSLKERGGGREGRWGKGRYGCMVFEGSGEAGRLGNVGDEVEMMLSLLSEEVGEDCCFGVRERNGRFSRRVEVENERREDSNGMSFRSRKKNMGSVGLRSSLKRDQEYETARYREDIKKRKENVREEKRDDVSRCENCRVKIEGSSTSKTDQGSNVARYREEKKKQNGDRREEIVQNLSESENHMVRKEGSTWKSDQEYDTARYREEIKKQKADRREEEKEHLLRSENRKVRKEGSTSRSDQEYAPYMEEIKRQKDNRREEEKEHLLRIENHKVRKEGSTSRRDQEYARYMEEIERQKDDRREEERENLSRGENRKLRKEGSSCSSYYSVSSAGEFESDTELQVKDDRIVGQTSSEYKEDWKMNEDIRYDGEVKEKVKRRGDYVKEHEVLLRKEKTAEGFYGQSTGIEHDWRKKSEKKLSEVAIEQTEYRQNLAEEHMRLSKIEKTGYLKSSDIQQQYNERLDKSTSAVNVNEGTTQEHSLNADRISEQAESRIKYKHFKEMPEIHSSIVQTTLSSGKQYTRLEKNANTSVSLVQETKRAHNETADRVARQDEYRRDSQEIVNVSEIQEIDKRGTSSSLFETRMKKLNDDSSMVIDLVDDREEKHQKTGQVVTRQMGSHANSQQMTGILETEEMDTERMALSRRKADIRMKKQEEKSEVTYVETKVADAQRVSQKSTNRQERYITSMAEAKVIETKMVSEKSTSSQEMSSTSVVESIDETTVRHSLTDKGMLQVETRKSTRRPVKASSFNEGMPKEASSSYKSLKLIPESVVLQIKGDDGGQRSSQPIVTPPPLRLESTSNFSSESFGSGSSELQAQPKSSSALGSETYGGDRRSDSCGESLDFISHEDALGSAARLQQSSTYIVGEFVDKVRHEVSTSEAQTEKKMHETKPEQGDGDREAKAKSLRQDCSEGSRRSSRGSGAKGPSDEMWLVADQSIQRLPETEAPESTDTTTESGVVNRTGRSLWHVIGDVVRMRWASSRSETRTSKSGGKSSPNLSTGTEAWFSGHEADENNDENAKTEQTILHQGTSSSENQQPGGVRSEIQVEISSSNSESALELRGGSLPPVEGSSSGNEIVEPSFPLPAIRMTRSPVVKDISGVVKADASGSGKMVEMDQPVPVNFPGESVTEANDEELKRRRFQRSDHVSRDRFDEWEEAHSLETEQRKIDEMFMKEALFEARKGADMWEVPVGAVLVQHGKIIARGYNLVEDLRDSTAHAEMICIREASNVLRTWRLSDTTLYVTLEPCPMCAGAILQSRVDTVVWGAPNKLLGADGSWIRLFPNGGGGNDLELGDKAAGGPVHPFHPNIVIRRGILSSECADVMQQFFQLRRKKKEKKSEQPPTPPSCLPISHQPTKFLAKMHDAFHMMFCL